MTQIILASFLCLFALQFQSEEIVRTMSREEVVITATFDGSDIHVFGAVKREKEIPEGVMHLIVTISGPLLPVVLRSKENTYDIWAKRNIVVVDAAPHFYAVATSGN